MIRFIFFLLILSLIIGGLIFFIRKWFGSMGKFIDAKEQAEWKKFDKKLNK